MRDGQCGLGDDRLALELGVHLAQIKGVEGHGDAQADEVVGYRVVVAAEGDLAALGHLALLALEEDLAEPPQIRVGPGLP